MEFHEGKTIDAEDVDKEWLEGLFKAQHQTEDSGPAVCKLCPWALLIQNGHIFRKECGCDSCAGPRLEAWKRFCILRGLPSFVDESIEYNRLNQGKLQSMGLPAWGVEVNEMFEEYIDTHGFTPQEEVENAEDILSLID